MSTRDEDQDGLSLLEEQGMQATVGQAVQLAMQVQGLPVELLDAAIKGLETQMRGEKRKGAHEMQLLGYEEKIEIVKSVRHLRKRLDDIRQSLQARAAIMNPMPPDGL